MNEIAKALIIIGIVSLSLGGLLLFWEKVPFLGKLPGDIVIKRENFTFYFPIATCILLSVVVSLFFMFFNRR